MNKILEKLLNKYFRWRITKEWSEKIKAYNFTDEQEKKLANAVAEEVKNEIKSAIGEIENLLNQAFWVIDGTIEFQIDEIEKAEEEENLASEDDSPWVSDEDLIGEVVICSYEGRKDCSCLHNKPHIFDISSCYHNCSASEDMLAKCVKTNEPVLVLANAIEEEEIEEVLKTGGV